MKFIRLLPEQIMGHWSSIKNCVWNALPPITYDSEEAILRIQEKLLLGSMHCWLAVEALREHSIYAVAVTQIIADELSGERSLLLFSVNTAIDYPATLWNEAYAALSIFAKYNKCVRMVAYSNQPSIFHIAESLGADISWHYIQFQL